MTFLILLFKHLCTFLVLLFFVSASSDLDILHGNFRNHSQFNSKTAFPTDFRHNPSDANGDDDTVSDAKSFEIEDRRSGVLSTDLPKLSFANYSSDVYYRSYNVTPSDDRGMWILYEITNWFLLKIQPNDFPDYLLTDNDLTEAKSLIRSFKEHYRQWIKYEQGFIIVVGISLILALFFTVCYAIYFCFCRTCCCCWSSCKNSNDDEDEEKIDKKLDSCKRHCYSAVLFLIVLIMSFAMVCAVISNQYLHNAVSNLANNLRSNVDDVSLYKEDTNSQLKHLLVEDYRKLNSTINSALNVASDVIVHRTKIISGAISLDKLAEISKKAFLFEHTLQSLEHSTTKLQYASVRLRNNLTKLKEWFGDELRHCLNGFDDAQKNECQSAMTLFDNYKNLPDDIVSSANLDELKRPLQRILSYSISTRLAEVEEKFDFLKTELHEKILEDKKKVVAKLNEIGQNLENKLNDISQQINRVDVSQVKQYIDNYDEDVQYYEFYRYISSFVICGCICVVILFFFFGLLFGICGRRPGYYEDDCCVWSKGGCLYCGGIFFGVIFLLTFMCLTVCLFMIGGNSRTIICQSLENASSPAGQSSGFFNIMQRYLDVMKKKPNLHKSGKLLDDVLNELNITTLFNGCAENRTLFSMFDLDKRYDLHNLKSKARDDAHRELNAYLSHIDNYQFKINLNSLITKESEKFLNEIQDANVSSQMSSEFVGKLINDTTFNEFEEHLALLEQAASGSNYIELRNILKTLVGQLKTLENEDGSIIRGLLSDVALNLTELSQQVESLLKDVPDLVRTARNAEQLLATNLTGYVQTVAKQLVEIIRSYIDEYLNRIEERMDNEVTSCKPLQRIASSAMVSVCDASLNPFNGFWASVGVCLLLSMPAMILSIWLRDLYGSTSPYVSDHGHSTITRGRNGRVNAFMTTATDNYEYYSRLDDSSSAKRNSRNKKSAGWRTPSNSIYYSDINNFPPPPYYNNPSGRR